MSVRFTVCVNCVTTMALEGTSEASKLILGCPTTDRRRVVTLTAYRHERCKIRPRIFTGERYGHEEAHHASCRRDEGLR